MKTSTYTKITIAILAVVLLLAGFFWLRDLTKNDHFTVGSDTQIDVTPTQIMSIKAIGEWEFLSINDEELVDTTRKRLLADDELVRIYYGTLRLGVDMRQVSITARGDTVVVAMPRVRLLSDDFIDEARTQAFYESGKWSPREREALYQKAKRQMKRHALTPQNLQSAQDNGDAQLRRVMKAMGYNNINIIWSN
jgi:hypothetical protein